MMTGRVTHHSDYCQVDLQVCNGLQAVACATEQELRDMQLTFEPPNGQAFALSHSELSSDAPSELCNDTCLHTSCTNK